MKYFVHVFPLQAISNSEYRNRIPEVPHKAAAKASKKLSDR